MGFLATLLVSVLVVSLYLSKTDQNLVTVNSATSSSQASKEDSKSASIQTNKIMNKISVLESIIDTYYLNKVEDETLANGIYKGLLDSLGDPYSCYYTAEEYASLMESTNGVYCGIGATVTKDMETGVIKIVKPFVNGPAYKAGMLPNDIIYKVNGKEVTNDDLSSVVSRMKGEKGTKVTVTVVRDGEKDPIDITMTRDEIEVPTVESKMMDDNIGYISVSEFDKVTASQFRKSINKLEKAGMKSLIVDLRNNPGGRLETVVDMLDRLLPDELIVYQEDKNGKRDEEYGSDKQQFEKPLVVLINGNSASASEIFAGAIQDYGTGTLIGTTSFGKGIVQSIIPLNDGTAVKVTVSKYFTPKGRNIHGTGIEPDIEVELDAKSANKVVLEYEEDTQLQKAVSVLKEKMNEAK